MEDGRRADQGGARRPSARRRRSASAAPSSRSRPSTTRRRSRPPWSSASRSPSWCPRRAGSAPCAGHVGDLSNVVFKADDRLKLVVLQPRPPPSCWCSPPTAASTRSRPRSCRAGAATASRSACSSTWSRRPTSSRCFRSAAARKLLVASRDGRGFVVPEDEMPRHHPQGQAGAQCRAARRGARGRAGRGRHGRGHRREPQDADLPARAGAGDGARRAACACSATRMAGCPTSRPSRRPTA